MIGFTPDAVNTALANPDAEWLVIGNLLAHGDPESFSLVSELLSPPSFTVRKHRLVFEAMQKVWNSGDEINYGTVTLQLREDGTHDVVGSVVDLCDGIPGLANLESFCEKVAEAERKRKLWKAAEEIQQELMRGTPSEEVVKSTEDIIHGTQGHERRSRAIQPLQIVEAAGGQDEFITPSSLGLIPTPYPRLNEQTGGGMRKGQVWTLGALSSGGKSSFAYNIINDAIFTHYKRVKVISLEVPKEEVLFALACIRAKVDSQRARVGLLLREEMARLVSALDEYRYGMNDYLEIEDAGVSTIPAISGSLRKNKAQGREIDLLVIDFMQLLSGIGKFSSRREEVDQFSYGIKKEIANVFKIPVLSLAQLNERKLPTTEGKKNAPKPDAPPVPPPPPSMGDFREAASIEHSTDVGIILRRTDIQQQFTERQLIDLFLVKQRTGRLGKIPYVFLSKTREFEEVARKTGVGDA